MMKEKIELTVNEEKISFFYTDIPNLLHLLKTKIPNFNKKNIAVTVNKNLIKKKDWGIYTLKPNDIIEIVTPFPGG